MQSTILILTVLGLFVTGCAAIKSSYHYTKGTQYLDNGNIEAAIGELNQAVDLYPDMGRNHTNLAAAYMLNNNVEKAWFHCRQAVLCPYQDADASLNFVKMCDLLIIKAGLNQPGVSQNEVLQALGLPDITISNENHSVVFYHYGTCSMEFHNGILTNCTLGIVLH